MILIGEQEPIWPELVPIIVAVHLNTVRLDRESAGITVSPTWSEAKFAQIALVRTDSG